MTMPALKACLKVTDITEASGIPYVVNMAKIAIVIFKLLEQKGKNKKDFKELCESITNTIVVISTLVRMQGEAGAPYFMGICTEMEGYLKGMVQDIKDIKQKHLGLKGIFSINEFQDTIQAYRRHVDDLKTDFMIHSVGCLLMNATPQVAVHHSEDSDEFIFWIPKQPVAIAPLFFWPDPFH